MSKQVISVSSRRSSLRFLMASTVMVIVPASVHAQSETSESAVDYPSRTVKIIVPNAPGGGTEIVARSIAQKMSDVWGEAVVVENRPGGNAIIGTDVVAKSKPDGYTVLLTFPSHITNPIMYPKLPYSEHDFAPVTMVDQYPWAVVVHPSLPVKNVGEFIAYAKAHPKQLNYGTTGVGSSPHLGTLLFLQAAGIDILHVPYKGAGLVAAALASGEVQLALTSMLASQPMIEAGKVRLLAVTSARRLPSFPDVPTVAETLPGFEAITWHGMLVPASTPAAIIAKIYDETVRALQMPDVRARLTDVGLTIVGNTPEEFGAFLAEDSRKWSQVIKEADLHLEEK